MNVTTNYLTGTSEGDITYATHLSAFLKNCNGKKVSKEGEPLAVIFNEVAYLPVDIAVVVIDYTVENFSEKFIKKAKTHCDSLKCIENREIFEYIKDRASEPDFSNNPQAFMQKWKEKRGMTQEFRLIEDTARRIMNLLLAQEGEASNNPPTSKKRKREEWSEELNKQNCDIEKQKE